MTGDKNPWDGLIDNFGNPMDKMPDEIFPSAAAILFNEDRSEVLLQRRIDNASWALPAGRMDIGESVAECAIRECEEETGLTTRIKRLVGVFAAEESAAVEVTLDYFTKPHAGPRDPAGALLRNVLPHIGRETEVLRIAILPLGASEVHAPAVDAGRCAGLEPSDFETTRF